MSRPRIRRLLSLVVGRRSIERDVDVEMRFHIQMRVEDLMRGGERREDAEQQAAREYGDIAEARRELTAIDQRRLRSESRREWLGSLGQDLRFGLRGLRSRPAFTITVLLTLALGIGANAAIFSFVDSVLLRALPFDHPDRLVHLWETFQSRVDQRSEASFPDYLEWRTRNTAFTGLAGYEDADFLVGAEHPATVGGAKVTANFFDVLGVRPLVGRPFVPNEDAPGAPKVVLLTYGFWQREFGGERALIGRSITVDGTAATVIGVLPETFRFSLVGDPQVIAPIDRSARTRQTRDNHWLKIIGRLREGVGVRGATRNLSAVMRDLATAYPETNAGRDVIAVPLHDEMVGSARIVLLLVYGAVVVVLLVACVNVANLLLIRGAHRNQEIAVRAALGAGRSRLVRQLLTEGLLLAVCGGVLGLMVAEVGVHALLGLLPARQMRGFPELNGVHLDLRVVAYALFVAVAAGIGFGVIPALRTTSVSLNDALRSGGRGAINGRSRLRDGLVAGEIALTVILLSEALLFGQSLLRLLAVDPGFRTDHLVTANVVLPAPRYATPALRAQFFQRLGDGIRQLPDVESVGFITDLPPDVGEALGFDVVGRPPSTPGQTPRASFRHASADYFHTLRIPVLQGRVFAATDDAAAPPVLVINRALADVYFAGENPIGRRLYLAGDTMRIVGVVGDVPVGNLGDKAPPTVYLGSGKYPHRLMAVAVRTNIGTAQLAGALRRVVSSIDGAAALSAIASMDDLVTQSPSVFMRRFPMFVVGAFALTALLLAVVGIYGVVSYSVAQRTREMGIRMALGAEPATLVQLVMRHGVAMAGLGITVGVIAALLLGRFAQSLLYGVSSADPSTYVSVAVVLSVAAIVATILPARRATRVDPALALRSD